MSEQPADGNGDYSYDLAHDMPQAHAEGRPPGPAVGDPLDTAQALGAGSGDWSYDLAHEVPQREL